MPYLMTFSSDNRDSGTTDDFIIRPNPSIDLGLDKWECALTSYSLVNANPNISPSYGNNTMEYSPDAATWKLVTFPEGSYSVPLMQSLLDAVITANGDTTGNITFVINFATLKVTVALTAPYQVRFTSSTFYELLGFDNTQLGPLAVSTVGNNVADVNRGVVGIYLKASFVETTSSLNSKFADSILGDVRIIGTPPGSIYSERIPNLLWVDVVNEKKIEQIRLQIVDQANRAYYLRNEPVGVQVLLRKKKSETIQQTANYGSGGLTQSGRY